MELLPLNIATIYLVLSMMFRSLLNLLEIIGVLKINCIGFLMVVLIKMLPAVVGAIVPENLVVIRHIGLNLGDGQKNKGWG